MDVALSRTRWYLRWGIVFVSLAIALLLIRTVLGSEGASRVLAKALFTLIGVVIGAALP